MSEKQMQGYDAINGAMAECYVTLDSVRYNFMQMICLEAKMTRQGMAVPILGGVGAERKYSRWHGTFTAKAHYNSTIFRKVLQRFKDTGEDLSFEMQVTNDDPATSFGRQTVILMDCRLDGGILAKFDADAGYLQEEISGTFGDFRIPQSFTLLDGMR